MARFKEDRRDTYQFISSSLDDLLPADSVARAIWSGLESLDFSEFEAGYSNDVAGCTALDPRCLCAVWMLALVRGVHSSVRLAALCATDIEFRWLMGDGPVEKSTLAAFRKERKAALTSLSAQLLVALGTHGLLPGENMGVDGTVVRAASSKHAVKSRRRLRARVAAVEEVLGERLSREDSDSEAVQALERRRARLEQALETMTARGLDEEEARMNTTEPDAPKRKQKDGSFAPGYNAQAVTDLDTGAVIHAQVVDAGNDAGQLQPQVEQAQEALRSAREAGEDASGEDGAGPDDTASRTLNVAADGAYHDTRQLEELEGRGVRCFVPEGRNANRQAPGVAPPYQAEAFDYDEEDDCMRCPEGKRLKRRKLNENKTGTVYQATPADCAACPAKDKCCPQTKGGRNVTRTLPHYQQTLSTVAERLDTPAGLRMRQARWAAGEGIFSRLKCLLHWDRCHMWDMAGAEMELLWRQVTNNLLLLTGTWRPLALAAGTG